MLHRLPLEIQVLLLKSCPGTSLKYVNSHFYLLYNDLYFDKLIRTFGDDVIKIVGKVYPWLRTYIKTLDAFREESRMVITKRLKLVDCLGRHEAKLTDIIESKYIKDSWKYVYSLFKNKRLFAEYSDYKIDEPTNYIFNHYVEVNRSYLLSYSKAMWLAPGSYNLNVGLVVKSGSGLGTTKFEVKYQNGDGDEVIQTFYPPSNINEVLPKKQFCFLKVGEFTIEEPSFTATESPYRHGALQRVELTMEEIGLYLKSGFRIFFIDISQPSMLFNDYDLLFYSCQESDYKYFINLPLKNFYKALNCVQNGDDTGESVSRYGSGEPDKIIEKYDTCIPEDFLSKNRGFEDNLMDYARFFFNNKLNRRYYKFNTVYQRRQFVNRFGDFDLDSKDIGEEHTKARCSYDREGLKWRIPIVGEL